MASKPSDEALKKRFGGLQKLVMGPASETESQRRAEVLLLDAAKAVRDATPAGREQNAALKHLEEASFWVHAAIVRED